MPADPQAPVRQGGFALVAALFVLVMAAGIGAQLMRVSQQGSGGVDLAVQAQRARLAAGAGLQWAEYRIAATGACAAGTLALSEQALRGFVVTVSCSGSSHGAGPLQRHSYLLQSFAQTGRYGQPGYASSRAVETYLR